MSRYTNCMNKRDETIKRITRHLTGRDELASVGEVAKCLNISENHARTCLETMVDMGTAVRTRIWNDNCGFRVPGTNTNEIIRFPSPYPQARRWAA